jgi:sulfopyruvate decarboxylase TPP-binding subunit
VNAEPGSLPHPDPTAPEPAIASASELGHAVVDVLVRTGVGLVVYLPDSVLLPIVRAVESDGRIPVVVCAREDEGIAIAAGASLAGVVSVVVMEGSGIGYSGLVLARARLQRSTILVLASHSPLLGEWFDFHAASRIAGAGVLGGLGIPFEVARTAAELPWLLDQALVTVRGQREIGAILVVPDAVGGTR